jgi:TPP-dependent pyruvate/acetoin dehydrogenase alpha subunit
MYRKMQLIRRFEERVVQLVNANEIVSQGIFSYDVSYGLFRERGRGR